MVAFGRGREAQNNFFNSRLRGILLDTLEELTHADKLLWLLGGQGYRAAQHKVQAVKSRCALDIFHICVLFNNKEQARVASVSWRK